MEVSDDLSCYFIDETMQRFDTSMLRRFNPRNGLVVRRVIDQIGSLSAKEQGLRCSLTSFEKMIDSDDLQVLYLYWKKSAIRGDHSVVIGLLKVGYKCLYLNDGMHQTHQTTPLCVLDFYVHHTLQRRGYGHALFDYMLKCEESSPEEVAIDKPSNSLLQFMMKHYGMTDPMWQAINFVVYPPFFDHIERYNRANLERKKQKLPHVTFRERDNVGDIIRNATELPTRVHSDPQTPLGRKVIRDLGHQLIW